MKLSEAKVLFALTPFIQGLDLLGLESFFTQIKTFLFWGKVGYGQKRNLSCKNLQWLLTSTLEEYLVQGRLFLDTTIR